MFLRLNHLFLLHDIVECGICTIHKRRLYKNNWFNRKYTFVPVYLHSVCEQHTGDFYEYPGKYNVVFIKPVVVCLTREYSFNVLICIVYYLKVGFWFNKNEYCCIKFGFMDSEPILHSSRSSFLHSFESENIFPPLAPTPPSLDNRDS